MSEKYIGVFDSGIGGLTVLKSIIKKMPNENIVYFGDTKNLPYGDKSKEMIEKLVLDDASFLITFNLKALVIACNTADSVAHSKLSELYDLPIYGVLKPASLKAINTTKNKKIGVIATSATINSNAYLNTIKQIDNSIEVYSVSCPKLVGLVESGHYQKDDKQVLTALHEYLDPLKDKDIDTLILGCTHYPLLLDAIKVILPNINIISSSDAACETIFNEMDNKGGQGKRLFYVSSDPEHFKENASIFMDEEIKEKINLKEQD